MGTAYAVWGGIGAVGTVIVGCSGSTSRHDGTAAAHPRDCRLHRRAEDDWLTLFARGNTVLHKLSYAALMGKRSTTVWWYRDRLSWLMMPPFRIGRLAVDPPTRQIESGEMRETLEPRVMQVLVVLFRARGRVVTREELVTHCMDGESSVMTPSIE